VAQPKARNNNRSQPEDIGQPADGSGWTIEHVATVAGREAARRRRRLVELLEHAATRDRHPTETSTGSRPGVGSPKFSARRRVDPHEQASPAGLTVGD